MSLMDVTSLLDAISAENPCGEDLEYDAEFGEMERAAQGKPEQQMGATLIAAEQADWSLVKNKASALFCRTKDLRVAMHLTQSLLHTDGLPGFRDGLKLIQGLLEQYWDSVHPQLDPDDNNDPTLRINTLSALCDTDTVLQVIREAILVTSTTFGKIHLRDILIAQGKFSAPPNSKEKAKDISSINAAFMEAQLDELQTTADAIHQSIESMAAIESLLMEKVDAMQMADFSSLPNLLTEALQIMTEQLASRGVSDTAVQTDAVQDDTPTSNTVSQPVAGQINSREDVIRVLDMACDYLKKNEPSSPVPLLLQRAKRLIAKDFMEILRDLTPAGVAQAEEIGGISNQK